MQINWKRNKHASDRRSSTLLGGGELPERRCGVVFFGDGCNSSGQNTWSRAKATAVRAMQRGSLSLTQTLGKALEVVKLWDYLDSEVVVGDGFSILGHRN